MCVPIRTLADRLGLKLNGEGIAAGVRFLPDDGDDLREDILYLSAEREDHTWIQVGQERILVPGSSRQWFNRIGDCLEQFAQWELKLRELLLTRRLNEAMTLLGKIFGNAVYLVDSGFRVLAIESNEIYSELSAIWKHLVTYGFIPYHILSGLRSTGEMNALQTQKDASLFYSTCFNNKFINRCLYQDGVLWGHFFVVGYRRGFTDGDLAYAQWVGSVLEQTLSHLADPVFSRDLDHETFFLHVIDRSLTDREQIAQQLRPLGWDPEGKYRILSLRADVNILMLAPLLCDKLERLFSCRSVIWNDLVVGVFPIQEDAAGAMLQDRLRAFINQEALIAGLSDVFDGFYRLPDNCRQAVRALELGAGRPGSLTAYGDIAVTHLIRSLEPEFSLDMFCDKAVFRLRDYDMANESEYLHTLEVYLRSERRLTDTAAALFIHRNTLIYRIERISKLTGLDLDDPDIRLRVLMSCRILREKGTK